MLNKLGEELKEARVKNGVTLQQMASKTRIDLKFLEALENGNFSFLPELYVKAFLKEYSNFVGLDESLILKKYEFAKQGKAYEEKPPVADEPKEEEKPEETKQEEPAKKEPAKKEEPAKKKEPKHTVKDTRPLQTYDAMPPEAPKDDNSDTQRKKKILLGMVVGGTIVVIGLVYFLFFNNSSDIIVPEKPIDEVIEDNKRYIEEEPQQDVVTDTAYSAAASGDSLRLNIRTSDTSWVKILYDDKLVDEFILFPNSNKTVAAGNNFKITFGRSSAISLNLNNEPLQFSPGQAAVSHVQINNNGIIYLNTAPSFGQGQGNDTN